MLAGGLEHTSVNRSIETLEVLGCTEVAGLLSIAFLLSFLADVAGLGHLLASLWGYDTRVFTLVLDGAHVDRVACVSDLSTAVVTHGRVDGE